jgi:hypothetical protein
MSKIFIIFKLPEELNEYKIAYNAYNYYHALWDLSQKFREMRKYGDSKKKYTAMEIEKLFWEILNNSEVSLDE